MTPVELEGQLHSLSDGDCWTESHEELVVPVGGGAEWFEVALNNTRAVVEMSTAETTQQLRCCKKTVEMFEKYM